MFDKGGIVLASIVCGLFLLPGISQSESAILWDLIITVDFEKNPIEVNEFPVVIGTIVDHAGKPIPNADVKIRIDQLTVSTVTDSNGSYRYEFTENKQSDHYLVTVNASLGDKIGAATNVLEVSGPISTKSILSYYMGLPEFSKYINAEPSQFENDPIGLSLYNHYQKIYQEFLEFEQAQKELDEYQQLIEEQRQMSEELLKIKIEQENPSAGTFSGIDYEIFVDNLDLSVRDIIVNQLNHTTNVFEEAQIAMQQTLEEGGTYEEARQAYFEKLSISRETMNELISTPIIANTTSSQTNSTNVDVSNLDFNYNSTNTDLNQNSTATEENNNLQFEIDGTEIIVELIGSTIFLNVNDTIIELLVNGTEIIQVTNSTND